MRSKNIAALAAALCMVFSTAGALPAQVLSENFSITASAATIVDSGKCGDSATYTIDSDGVLTVSGTGEISAAAFEHDPNIKKVVVNKGITAIGERAFVYGSHITEVSLPSGLVTIGERAFLECESLEKVNIPDTVTTIGPSAFAGCNGLKSINIPASVTAIGLSAFGYCGSLTSINVSKSNNYFASLDGVLFNKKGTGLICFPSGKGGAYEIPDSIVGIADEAFAGSGVTRVTIPESVKSIGQSAFFDCAYLTEITIPEKITTIEFSTFKQCTSLATVTFSDTVTNISADAFEYCNKLKDVYYHGTEQQWGKISIGRCNEALEEATIHYIKTEPTPVFVQGDVNHDGRFNTADVITMIAVLKGNKAMPEADFTLYDWDGSGKFDYRDVMRAIQALKNG